MHRVLIISHTYIPPSNRGKLRALAARGLEVTVGVPQRWRDHVLGRTLEIAWERQNGVEVFPLPARHSGDAATLKFRGRALHALLRDKRPDLVQVEEEPTAPAARQVVRAARQLSLPAVLFTHQNVALPLPWLGGSRRASAGAAPCRPRKCRSCGPSWTCWCCRRAGCPRGPNRRRTWWRRRWHTRSRWWARAAARRRR